MTDRTTPPRDAAHARNVRTALVFVTVALVFFAGVFVARMLGPQGGLTLLGIAIVAFLVVAIGYSLRSRR